VLGPGRSYTWAMPRDQRTFCRICEAHCGLVVTVDDDDSVLDVRPDREHPVSKGYACIKGTSLGDLHHDPDRLDHPMKRVGEGWERIGWAQAISEIGEQVKALRRDHGDRSVALYTGNPTFFSMQQILYSAAFLEALGSPNHFASHSIDVNTKFHVSTEMYGLPTVHPVPDIGRTRFLMILGSNPAVSQMSVIHLPNALRRLQEIEQRGGRVVVVDPRRTETAKKVGEHLAIRPGTDVYLLLAMLHVIVHEDRLDLTGIDQVATGVDDFVAAARPWSPERVEPLTGVPAAQVRELARGYADADGAALYVSTGINMGPFGSVCYWLVQGLNLITGNLDRAGGLVVPPGPFDALALTKMLGMGSMWGHRTLAEGWHRVAGAFPVGALADEITIDHPQRVRALFVSAGNPAHSVPGHQLRDALGELDLLVCIDIYPNETADYADYLLPATDMLERSDYPISWANLQETPYAQWTDAVVAPSHERRQEWEIFSDLAVACGAPAFGRSLANTLPRLNGLLDRLPGDRRITPDHLLALLLRWGRKVSLSELREHPEGVPLPATPPGSFLARRVPTRDGLVHLAPLSVLRDLRRVRAAAAGFAGSSDDTLVLIGRRERRSHNSWMHNNPGISQPVANTALVHPEDAARLLLVDGELAAVSSPAGSVTLPVEVTDDVSQGVIAVPHGWGHTAALSRAGALGGGNINDVIPGGTLHVEPVSGQSIMLAHRVSVRPAPAADGGDTAGATAVGGASVS
jgi:anaerobic selenocysteine-containing dehydrogenase